MYQKIKNKKKAVINIKNLLSEASLCVLVNFSGVIAIEMLRYRKKCREFNGKMLILKNNVTERALREFNGVIPISKLEGQNLLFCVNGDDFIKLAKFLVYEKFIVSEKVKFIIFEKKIIGITTLKLLINIKNRDTQLHKLILNLKAPIMRLVFYLRYPALNFSTILSCIKVIK